MYIAVDIGGTKTLIAVFDESGEILQTERFPTDPEYGTFLRHLSGVITPMLDTHAAEAVCIAVPGNIDYETKHVIGFGNLQWHDVDIAGELQQALELPVIVDNDGNLGAVGEAMMGAGVNATTMLYVTVSTGIGSGITFNGHVDLALAHSEAGSMHFRHDGDLMRWEHFASGKAFVERFGAMGKDINDPDIWKQYAEDLSIGFGSLIAILQPDLIVIGGSMGEHLEKYRSFLLEALQNTRSPTVTIPNIVQAKHPDQAVIYGCYVSAKRYSQSNH